MKRGLRYSAALHPTWHQKSWIRPSIAGLLLTSGRLESSSLPSSVDASPTEEPQIRSFTVRSLVLITSCRRRCTVLYQGQRLTFCRVYSTQTLITDQQPNKSSITPGSITCLFRKLSQCLVWSRRDLTHHSHNIPRTESKCRDMRSKVEARRNALSSATTRRRSWMWLSQSRTSRRCKPTSSIHRPLRWQIGRKAVALPLLGSFKRNSTWQLSTSLNSVATSVTATKKAMPSILRAAS